MNTSLPPESLDRLHRFLSLPERERPEKERVALLKALGVKHPEKFLHSVWSTQWPVGIDRVLNPRSLELRPLERSDFHFKWALGSFNALPPDVRARVFSLKIEPNGLDDAIRKLFAKVGLRVASYRVLSVEVVDKIHTEAAVTLEINGEVIRTFEISHFALAGEQIFTAIAELTGVKTEPVYIYTTPQGVKVALETHLGKENLQSERLGPDYFLEHWQTILTDVAQQDALGDALGTICRDVHYNVTETGDVLTRHHRELFHELSEYTYGFFEPIYVFLNAKLPPEFTLARGNRVEALYQKYRERYLAKNEEIRTQWPQMRSLLESMGGLIIEYFGKPVNVAEIIQGVERRLFQDKDPWLEEIYRTFTEE